MPTHKKDISANFCAHYCAVCDVSHEKGGLYCSTRCQKLDAKIASESPSKIMSENASALMERSKSNPSLYTMSNASSSSFGSMSRAKHDSTESSREIGSKATRPPFDRKISNHRPLPPTKRNSYSSSAPKSIDLVTPVLAPLTLRGMS